MHAVRTCLLGGHDCSHVGIDAMLHGQCTRALSEACQPQHHSCQCIFSLHSCFHAWVLRSHVWPMHEPMGCGVPVLQHTTPDKSAPPLPALLDALKTGLDSYQSIREDLLRTDEEEGKAPDAAPTEPGCLDLHEKCPFWAATVSSRIPELNALCCMGPSLICWLMCWHKRAGTRVGTRDKMLQA